MNFNDKIVSVVKIQSICRMHFTRKIFKNAFKEYVELSKCVEKALNLQDVEIYMEDVTALEKQENDLELQILSRIRWITMR